MNTTHTPGPWYVHPRWRHVCAKGDHDCVVSMSPPWMMKYERSRDEDLANLVLIAAAPDSHAANIVTVAALREQFRITDDADDQWIYDELGTALSSAYFMARAAIAKATGASA